MSESKEPTAAAAVTPSGPCGSGGCGGDGCGKAEAGGGCCQGKGKAGGSCCGGGGAETNTEADAAAAAALAEVKQLVGKPGVFIFMKGTVEEPKCKNTRKLLATFKEHGVKNFTCFDILPLPMKDPGSVRFQATKYATEQRGTETLFPQIWVDGQCLGGNDMLDWCVKWNCLDRVLKPAAFENVSSKAGCCSSKQASVSASPPYTVVTVSAVGLAFVALAAMKFRRSVTA
eukprot:gb/GEZN01012617.1/.p1 GENE.gb/GEZN01012617.1/~~gb/GEZN01012617.1/.p1  ORF type:complete len:253 (-),score=43.31 gb/GEZN01012617.1/:307-996(-)